MATPFVGQLMLAPYNFAPTGWLLCAGQLLPISQNTALFSLIGTYYGGNGTSNFALPNMAGLTPVGVGQGPGLSLYDLGQTGGSQTVTLLDRECPAHNHNIMVGTGRANIVSDPTNAVLAEAKSNFYAPAGGSPQTLGKALTPFPGGSQPHDNMMPYQVLNWYIATQGVYPSRG